MSLVAAGFVFYPFVYIVIFIILDMHCPFFVHRIQAVLLTTPNLDVSKMTERYLVHYPSCFSMIVIHAVRFLSESGISTGITGTNILLTWFVDVQKQRTSISTPSLACSTMVGKINHLLING